MHMGCACCIVLNYYRKIISISRAVAENRMMHHVTINNDFKKSTNHCTETTVLMVLRLLVFWVVVQWV
jgi:hypothetical protein